MTGMTTEEYRTRSREYEMREARKGLIAHTLVVTAVSALPAGINLFFTPAVLWFIFPLAGMTFGVVIHYALGYRLANLWLDKKERRMEEWR